MSASEKRMKIAALSQLMAQSAAGIGGDSAGGRWGANMGQMAANYAQAEAEKEAAKEAEKKKKSGVLGKILGTVGAIAMPALAPAMAPVLAGGLGGALGSTAGQMLGGGGVDLGSVLTSGAGGAVGGMMPRPAAAPQAAVPPDQSVAMMQAPPMDAAPGAFESTVNAMGAKTMAAPTPSFGSRFMSSAMNYGAGQQMLGGMGVGGMGQQSPLALTWDDQRRRLVPYGMGFSQYSPYGNSGGGF